MRRQMPGASGLRKSRYMRSNHVWLARGKRYPRLAVRYVGIKTTKTKGVSEKFM